MILQHENIVLRILTVDDVTHNYVDWLNDPDVVCYTEQRWRVHSFDDVLAFVNDKITAPTETLFGIFVGSRHIGNLKIGPVNNRHNYADISYLIGDKNFWGKGYATRVVSLGVAYGFKELGLNRLNAGVYANNIGSSKVLEKNGFIREGVCKDKFFFEGGFIDGLNYGLLKTDWLLREGL